MTNILLTGTAGFIGSNFIPYFLEKYSNYNLINLDLLTYAGNLENLKECEDNPRYKFIKGDICNRELVEFIFNKYDINDVIHFAAESHVDNSIKNPGVFIETNVNGTFTLLDVAYKSWMEKPFKYRDRYLNGIVNDECLIVNENDNSKFNIKNLTLQSSLPRFHHISTDEVYGTLNETNLFTEETPYAPNSPYSASKASSDMIVRSYQKTYGLNTVITNCSNNYGPKQHDEKLIPTIIRKALAGENIPIYGDGKNIRDWLYVLDHCKGIDVVYHTGKEANVYNIGGRNERTNLQIVDKICEILDKVYPSKNNSTFNIQHLTFKKEIAMFLLKDSWPLILSGMVIAVYMKIDQVMIKEMLDAEAVGQYAAAVRLSEAWYFIPMVIASSLFPAIINAKKQSEELYYSRLQKLYDLMVWMAIAIALPMTFLSDWVVNLLYGGQYNQAGSVLMIHIWAGVMVFFGVARHKWTITQNLQKYEIYIDIVGAISNVVLNLVLIPNYGINGAALATLISYFIGSFVVSIFLKDFHISLIMFIRSFFLPIKIIIGKI